MSGGAGGGGGAAVGGGGGGAMKTPVDFLKSIRGRPVVVKLNSGVDYRGEAMLASAGLDVDWYVGGEAHLKRGDDVYHGTIRCGEAHLKSGDDVYHGTIRYGASWYFTLCK